MIGDLAASFYEKCGAHVLTEVTLKDVDLRVSKMLDSIYGKVRGYKQGEFVVRTPVGFVVVKVKTS